MSRNVSLWMPAVYVYIGCCWRYFYMSLIYGEYLVNVHFSDIPHTFIPHFTPHSAEKNPHQIFRKLPVENFPHSAIRIPRNTPSQLSYCWCLLFVFLHFWAKYIWYMIWQVDSGRCMNYCKRNRPTHQRKQATDSTIIQVGTTTQSCRNWLLAQCYNDQDPK